MKQFFALGIFLLLGIMSYGQINYEKGYIITNSGNKIEAYIRNSMNIQKEGEFTYRLTEKGETQKIGVAEVQEFGIGDNIKFLSRTVKIDQSSSNQKDLDEGADPEYIEDRVFLQVLVDGEASLYFYKSNNHRFFYNISGDNDIQPLVYKKYLIDGSKIQENNAYRRQLYDDLKCNFKEPLALQDIDYKRKDLIDFFIAYNDCQGSAYEDLSTSDSEFKVNLNIRPGANFNDFELTLGRETGRVRQFGESTAVGFRIGIETELLLPFNRNKWGIFVEPSFQQFSFEYNNYQLSAKADLSSIEIPAGVRYYMFLNDESKIFLNAAIVSVFDLQSEIDIEFSPNAELSNEAFLTGGVGFKFMDKYSAEFRVNAQRNVFKAPNETWFSEFRTMSLILGYTIF